MKKTSVFTMLLLLALLAAASGVSARSNTHFEAHLSGGSEVPPNSSKAAGQAVFRVVDGGNAIEYRLIVASLDDLHMAHIHRASAGANGGIVVWLYPSAPPAVHLPGTTNGVLAVGRITAANLTGPLAGQPLSVLIDEMAAGNTYVNVHTMNFPGGEIRGQIK